MIFGRRILWGAVILPVSANVIFEPFRQAPGKLLSTFFIQVLVRIEM